MRDRQRDAEGEAAPEERRGEVVDPDGREAERRRAAGRARSAAGRRRADSSVPHQRSRCIADPAEVLTDDHMPMTAAPERRVDQRPSGSVRRGRRSKAVVGEEQRVEDVPDARRTAIAGSS